MISMVVMKTRRRAICIPTFGSQSLNIYRFDYKKIRDASVGTQVSGRKSRDANGAPSLVQRSKTRPCELVEKKMHFCDTCVCAIFLSDKSFFLVGKGE